MLPLFARIEYKEMSRSLQRESRGVRAWEARDPQHRRDRLPASAWRRHRGGRQPPPHQVRPVDQHRFSYGRSGPVRAQRMRSRQNCRRTAMKWRHADECHEESAETSSAVIAKWLSEQTSAGTLRPDLMKESELREQSGSLLPRLREAAITGGWSGAGSSGTRRWSSSRRCRWRCWSSSWPSSSRRSPPRPVGRGISPTFGPGSSAGSHPLSRGPGSHPGDVRVALISGDEHDRPGDDRRHAPHRASCKVGNSTPASVRPLSLGEGTMGRGARRCFHRWRSRFATAACL
jgi:hypothetical protein